MNLSKINILLANLGYFLLIVFVLLNIFSVGFKSISKKIILIIGIVIILFYANKNNNLNIIWYLRGLGDLSTTTIIYLSLMIIKQIFSFNFKLENIYFSVLIICVGIILYLSSFGFIHFDIYALGFLPSNNFLFGFILIECFLWFVSSISAGVLLLAFLGFYFNIQTSTNIWDYFIDPILWFACIVVFIRTIIKFVIK